MKVNMIVLLDKYDLPTKVVRYPWLEHTTTNLGDNKPSKWGITYLTNNIDSDQITNNILELRVFPGA